MRSIEAVTSGSQLMGGTDHPGWTTCWRSEGLWRPSHSFLEFLTQPVQQSDFLVWVTCASSSFSFSSLPCDNTEASEEAHSLQGGRGQMMTECLMLSLSLQVLPRYSSLRPWGQKSIQRHATLYLPGYTGKKSPQSLVAPLSAPLVCWNRTVQLTHFLPSQ